MIRGRSQLSDLMVWTEALETTPELDDGDGDGDGDDSDINDGFELLIKGYIHCDYKEDQLCLTASRYKTKPMVDLMSMCTKLHFHNLQKKLFEACNKLL